MLQYGRTLGQEQGSADEPRRHLYLIASLLRRWKTLAVCVAVAMTLGAIVLASKPVTYTASTQLLIYNRELNPGPDAVVLPGRADTALVENMIEIFKSRNVIAKVIETLKLNEDNDRGLVQTLWPTIRDWVMSPSSQNVSEEEKVLESAIERFRDALSVKRAGTSHTILVTYTAADPHKAAAIANDIALSAARVFRGTEAGSSGASPLRERLQGLGPSAYVISEADPPARPDGPGRATLGMLFLLAGLGIGVAIALLQDFMDRTIRTAGQVQGMLGLECFGTVARTSRPAMSGRMQDETEAGGVRNGLPSGGGRGDRWSDSCARVLQRALTVTDSILAMQVLGVTAMATSEGTTTMAGGLALMATASGKTVLRVDLAKRGDIGSLGAYPRPSDSFENPHVMEINEPAELEDVIRQVAPEYDLVVVDLPPLSDDRSMREIARMFDGIVLVLKWGDHGADAVRRALESSGFEPSQIAGVILNEAPRSLIGRYGDKLAGAQTRLAMWPSVTHAPKTSQGTEEGGELAPV